MNEWEEYLLSIGLPEGSPEGVTNLNDDKEIDEKLNKVEREDPLYQERLMEALEEIVIDTGKPLETFTKQDIVDYLLSTGD